MSMAPILGNTITRSRNYDGLSEIWYVPDIGQFSHQKTLYNYQRPAMENAAHTPHLYYESPHNCPSAEPTPPCQPQALTLTLPPHAPTHHREDGGYGKYLLLEVGKYFRMVLLT